MHNRHRKCRRKQHIQHVTYPIDPALFRCIQCGGLRKNFISSFQCREEGNRIHNPGSELEQEQQNTRKPKAIEQLLAEPNLITGVNVAVTIRHTQAGVEEFRYITRSIGRECILRMNLRVLIVNAVALLTVNLPLIILALLNRTLRCRVYLVDKVQCRLAFQNTGRIIARIGLTEEIFVVFASNDAPIRIRVNWFFNPLKSIGDILRVITNFQTCLDFVDPQASGFLLHIVL